MAEQNFENHVRLVPVYHFFVLPMLAVNVGWVIYRVVKAGFSIGGAIWILASLAILLAALFGRMFALSVQNRIIRLEERLRMERLLPADLQGRIGEFSCGQLIALRFASDAELPELARKVLADKIRDGKAIKKMVKNWRGDYLRA
jgi:hypothetical protein